MTEKGTAPVCPVATLWQYLASTKSLRDPLLKGKGLFLSYAEPHKPVATSTIGHWIVSVLVSSGVDGKFRACIYYNTRSASIGISGHQSR